MVDGSHYESDLRVPPVGIRYLPPPRRKKEAYLPLLSPDPPRETPSGPTYADFLRDEEEARKAKRPSF